MLNPLYFSQWNGYIVFFWLEVEAPNLTQCENQNIEGHEVWKLPNVMIVLLNISSTLLKNKELLLSLNEIKCKDLILLIV